MPASWDFVRLKEGVGLLLCRENMVKIQLQSVFLKFCRRDAGS